MRKYIYINTTNDKENSNEGHRGHFKTSPSSFYWARLGRQQKRVLFLVAGH